MPTTASAAAVALTSGNLSDLQTDLLVVPVFDGESAATAVPGLDDAAGGALSRATASGEFRGRAFELFLTPLTDWAAPRLALIGAGKAADFDTERLRKVATAAALAARQRRIQRIAFVNRGGGEPAAAVQAIAEGLVAGHLQRRRLQERRAAAAAARTGARGRRAAGRQRWRPRSSAAGSSASRATSRATSATSRRTC